MLHVVTTPSLALLTSVTTAPSEYSDRSTADTRDVALYTEKVESVLLWLFHNVVALLKLQDSTPLDTELLLH